FRECVVEYTTNYFGVDVKVFQVIPCTLRQGFVGFDARAAPAVSRRGEVGGGESQIGAEFQHVSALKVVYQSLHHARAAGGCGAVPRYRRYGAGGGGTSAAPGPVVFDIQWHSVAFQRFPEGFDAVASV